MAKPTPEQEALYALQWDVSRGDLSMAAQLEYDRLKPHSERKVAATVKAASRPVIRQDVPSARWSRFARQPSVVAPTFGVTVFNWKTITVPWINITDVVLTPASPVYKARMGAGDRAKQWPGSPGGLRGVPACPAAGRWTGTGDVGHRRSIRGRGGDPQRTGGSQPGGCAVRVWYFRAVSIRVTGQSFNQKAARLHRGKDLLVDSAIGKLRSITLQSKMKITVHPGQPLTDELALALVIAARWLSWYFWPPVREGDEPLTSPLPPPPSVASTRSRRRTVPSRP